MKRSFQKDLCPKAASGRLEGRRSRSCGKGRCSLSNLFPGVSGGRLPGGLCHLYLAPLNADNGSLDILEAPPWGFSLVSTLTLGGRA